MTSPPIARRRDPSHSSLTTISPDSTESTLSRVHDEEFRSHDTKLPASKTFFAGYHIEHPHDGDVDQIVESRENRVRTGHKHGDVHALNEKLGDPRGREVRRQPELEKEVRRDEEAAFPDERKNRSVERMQQARVGGQRPVLRIQSGDRGAAGVLLVPPGSEVLFDGGPAGRIVHDFGEIEIKRLVFQVCRAQRVVDARAANARPNKKSRLPRIK